MSDNRCFLISGFAIKMEADSPESSTSEDTVRPEMEYQASGSPPKQHVAHLGGLAVANSKDEAERLLLEHILTLWPEAQGWTAHATQANEIPGKQLEAALDALRTEGAEMLLM